MNYYCVVYQMGKVASTSIVDTLDGIDGIDAVQSHFLGNAALAKIIPSLTDPEISDYFFKHSFGQFIENVEITRNITTLRTGRKPETRLLMVSLSRDPVDWIRSSVVQDIEGYIPVLKKIIEAAGKTAETDEEIVQRGLRIFLDVSRQVLERFGGIDELRATPQVLSHAFDKTIFRDLLEARRMFLMLLRPADWFTSHFKAATSLDITDMTRVAGAWEHSEEHADFVIVRYEDFRQSLPQYLRRKGIADIEAFSTRNLSESKPFAAEIAKVFASQKGKDLRYIYDKTAYAKTFGYTSNSVDA